MPDLSFKEFNKINIHPEKTDRGLEYKKAQIGIKLDSIIAYYYESDQSCIAIIGNKEFRLDISYNDLKALIETEKQKLDGKSGH